MSSRMWDLYAARECQFDGLISSAIGAGSPWTFPFFATRGAQHSRAAFRTTRTSLRFKNVS